MMSQLFNVFLSGEFKKCFLFLFIEILWCEVASLTIALELHKKISEYWHKKLVPQHLSLMWLKLKCDHLKLMFIVCFIVTMLIGSYIFLSLDEYELLMIIEMSHISLHSDLLDMYLQQKISLIDSVGKYLPLLAPLYYFYFKEQRAISESYLVEVDISFTNIIMMSCFTTGCIILGKPDKTITIALVAFGLITVMWLWIFIISFFHRLKPIALATMSSREAIKWLKIVLVCYEKKTSPEWLSSFSNTLCNRISLSFEILYQVIDYSLTKGVNRVLRDCINMLQETIRVWVTVTEQLPYLIQPETRQYELCRDILKNHKDLCIALHKERRTIEYDKTIKILFYAFPRQMKPKTMEDKLVLVDEYFKTYWSIFIYLLDEDRIQFQAFADEIFKLSNSDKEIIDNILVLRALVVAAVNDGNLTQMVEISYLLIKFSNKIESEYNTTDKTFTHCFWNNYIKKTNSDAKENYKGIMLYMLIQALIKTIELEHYDLTGYIVKHIVSNYNADTITKVCEKILRNKAYVDKRLRVENLFKRLNARFNINATTAIYCLKKAILMIKVQQKYMRREDNLPLPLVIFEKYNDEFNIEYCAKKILSVRDKYGMVSLLDYNFLDECMNNDNDKFEKFF